MSSVEEVECEDSGEVLAIALEEDSEVVKMLLRDKAPGVDDEIHPAEGSGHCRG